MKHVLNEEIVLNEESKSIKVLSNPSFKLIGLGFKIGQKLEKHSTSTKAILIVQSGNVDFFINGEKYNLQSGCYFEIPENVEHEVKAITDSYLYLIK
jgi:quercetin dioxygenase-like cupin family protein